MAEKNKPARRGPIEQLAPKQFLAIDEQESEDESQQAASVFFQLCRVFLGILKNGESLNLKVKHIALYKLFPRFVNLSLPFVTAEHSAYFLRILMRGCLIEWGSEAEKIKNLTPYLNLAQDFVKSGGLVLTTDDSGIFGV